MSGNSFYGFSATGPRPNQEDGHFEFPKPGHIRRSKRSIYHGPSAAVFDGVGGLAKGEVATSLAKLTIAGRISEWPNPDSSDYLLGNMVQVAADAHLAICQSSRSQKAQQGMACTVVLACMCWNWLHLIWVGDSRAYLLRNNRLHRLTCDHSFVQELAHQGLIDESQMGNHPQSNLITRALGTDNAIAEGRVVALESDDQVWLVTDGVTDGLSDVDFQTLLNELNHRHVPMVDQAQLVVQAALEAGSHDNTTAVGYCHTPFTPPTLSRFHQSNLIRTAFGHSQR